MTNLFCFISVIYISFAISCRKALVSKGNIETVVYQQDDSTLIKTAYNSIGKIFDADYRGKYYLYNTLEHWTPNREEALTADSIMMNCVYLNTGTTPKMLQLIKSYKRQYFGIVEKDSSKLIWINCFLESGSAKIDYWKSDVVTMNDGGDNYFNVLVNLKEKKCTKIRINNH